MSQPLMKHWDTKFLKKVEMLQTRPGLVRSIKIGWCHFALCIILAAGYYYGWSLKDEGYQPGSIFNVSPSLLDIELNRYMLTKALCVYRPSSASLLCILWCTTA
jgi:hypothetical protein